MRKTTERLYCDFCEAEIKDLTPAGFATIMGKDCCRDCIVTIHREVEDEYRRVIHSEVPCRRGGYLKLGDFADM